MQKEIILGFDARVIDSELKSDDLKYGKDKKSHISNKLFWDDERRKSFLYKNVSIPFSIDTTVWPSIFDIYDFSSTKEFTNFSELKKILDLNKSNFLVPYYIIAIALEITMFDKDEEFKYNHAYNCCEQKYVSYPMLNYLSNLCTPSKIENSWKRLGYDIADAYPGYGLTNFGRMKSLEEKIPLFVNDYHLFNNINNANEIKAILNKDEGLKRCHAPFSIYSIWLIEKKLNK